MVSVDKNSLIESAFSLKKLAALLMMGCVASPAFAEDGYTYSLFGTVGLLDMPTAESADDAELASSFNFMSVATRATVSFQITPRFAGSFRYSNPFDTLFDRSFDVQYR